VTQLRRLHH